MGASVENVYIETYEATVRHLAQQMDSRLRGWVDEKSVSSESHNWERLGSQEAIEKIGRLVDTPEQDYPFSRRKSLATTYHTGDSTEQEDIVQVLIDPNSNIARAQGMAMKRAQDDEIIRAAVGDSRDGQGNLIPFDAGQALGDGTTAITFDLVTATSEKFMEDDIDPDTEKCFVISPAQARKLLQLTEATSGDYNAVRPLTSKGYIESWMGYTWIVSTRLQGMNEKPQATRQADGQSATLTPAEASEQASEIQDRLMNMREANDPKLYQHLMKKRVDLMRIAAQ